MIVLGKSLLDTVVGFARVDVATTGVDVCVVNVVDAAGQPSFM